MKIKYLILICLLVIFAGRLQSQSLVDIYKKGTVKLVPDKEYAINNDWDKIFETYHDTIYNRPMGERKSIILTPDGSVVVNHAYRNYYSKFDSTGKFIKEFGIIGKSGKKFKDAYTIKGVLNGKFFTSLDNMGRMYAFDYDGNYVKELKLDYMTRDMIPLKNNKFAVVGWVIWKEKFRDFVAIVDYNTNEQKIIWEQFTERNEKTERRKLFNYSYTFENNSSIHITTMPYSKNVGINTPPLIEFVKDQLVIALPVTGEILIYNINGNLKSKDEIEWTLNSISVEEQKEIQQKAIERMKNRKGKFSPSSDEDNKKARTSILKQMEEDLNKISEPIPAPAFSTIIKDSDENLLFFDMPKEDGHNKFNVWVYGKEGQFICQSSFACDDYNLQINPSKMVFHNGYIYGLQTLKEVKGNPLRLVRFKIKGS